LGTRKLPNLRFKSRAHRRSVPEVIFIAMSRDLSFSLKEIGQTLPR